jgi:hypothetical protein
MDTLALLLSAGGVAAALVGAGAGQARAGLRMLLELWVAAALLRLTGSAAWDTVLAAALLVAARALLAGALARGHLRTHLR